MKNGKRALVTACVMVIILLGASAANAQITISWPSPTPFGKTVRTNVDTTISTTSLNLGQTGGPQTWTFNETVDQWTNVDFEVLSPDETPWGTTPDFQSAGWADHVWYFIPAFLGYDATVGDLYGYRQVSGGWIEEIGMGTTSTLLGGSPFVYATPSKVYPNPLTSASPSWEEKKTFNPRLLGLVNGTVKDSSVISVDAWGTLTVPSGPYDCLRLKRHEFRFITSTVLTDTLETYTYTWLTHDFDLVLSVTADASEGETFTEALYAILATDFIVAGCDPECQPLDARPEDFSLGQNYPNPFNPSTTIHYSLPAPAHVELSVFSILGQEVINLESGVKTQGPHETTWTGKDLNGNPVPSGVYFYQLQATPLSGGKAFVQTKKMVMTE